MKNTYIEKSIEHINAFMAKTGMKPSRLALNAGLSKNTLLGMGKGKLPSGETLQALEVYIRAYK